MTTIHRRSCPTCHQPEHTSNDLPAGCLISDLTHVYREGRHTGPGLYTQLIAALGDPRRSEPGEPTSHQKPGSRPPGWRDDVSELLAVMRYAVSRSNGWIAENVSVEDLTQWKLQARIALGLVTPSVLLADVVCARRVLTPAGWEWSGCGHVSLRVAQDAQSPVWCSRPECHDDHRYPNCRNLESPVDILGYPLELDYAPAPLTCRRTSKDLRHAMRWTRDEWFRLWAEREAVA